MINVIYIDRYGKEQSVSVPSGTTLMEGAVRNGVAGIEADCGGACACATCHVYLEPLDFENLPKPADMEVSMLEFSEMVEPTSRLACQVEIVPSMDGIRVRVAPNQL